MKCTPRRPPLNWSSDAIWRAASVGAVKPGRCASMKWIFSVCAAAYEIVSVALGPVEWCGTRMRSKPACSWACAKRRT